MTLKFSKAWIKSAALGLGILALGGCAAGEGARDNPLLRKFQWFSYLEGGDFKQACAPGQPGLYRMVYNAVYTEQVRIYELNEENATLAVRVFGKANLRNFSVMELNDLLNPWRGTEAVRPVAAGDWDALLAGLESGGAFGPPNVGAELSSKGFFWTIASCHEGRYRFTGFQWPDPAWDKAVFAERLFALDPTGLPINEPRRTITGRNLGQNPTAQGKEINEYHIKVGEDGLVGFSPLF